MKITLKDGSVKEYSEAKSVYDIALDISEGLARVSCAGEVDGEVVDLRTVLDKDCNLNIITASDPAALPIIRHTASHVLAEAVKRVFPEAKIAIGPSIEDGYFLDTGTRHFVKFVEDVEKVDVALEGKRLRWNEAFAPIGANVNFVQTLDPSTIKVRTFEKGVEAETLACGTGVTASAIASYIRGATGKQVRIFTREDELAVSFTPNADTFTDVYLTGPTLLLDIVEELL